MKNWTGEPSEEQPDPRTVARFPKHLSGGDPDKESSPFDEIKTTPNDNKTPSSVPKRT